MNSWSSSNILKIGGRYFYISSGSGHSNRVVERTAEGAFVKHHGEFNTMSEVHDFLEALVEKDKMAEAAKKIDDIACLVKKEKMARAAKKIVDIACVDVKRFFRWGMKPVPDHKAPRTLGQMHHKYLCSKSYEYPYPVSQDFCENTIYDSPNHNMVIRAWHDSHHIKLMIDTSFEGEVLLGQYGVLRIPEEEKDARVLYFCDSVGQTLYHEVSGKYPENQKEFVYELYRLLKPYNPLTDFSIDALRAAVKSIYERDV